MPDLIVGLADVRKSTGTVYSIMFKGFIKGVTDAVHLLNSGMFVTKSKLVIWYTVYVFWSVVILLASNRSSTLDILDSNLMGRYDVGDIRSLPGLGITILSTVLSTLSQYCVLSIPLNIYNRAINPFRGNSLSIFGVTKSGPGDFLILSVFIPF
jgi:hypothetical protein